MFGLEPLLKDGLQDFAATISFIGDIVGAFEPTIGLLIGVAGKEIILAVRKSNTVVRNEKYKWYNEEGENFNSKKTILVFLVFEFMDFDIIFLPFTIIRYLCLPFIIRLRNYGKPKELHKSKHGDLTENTIKEMIKQIKQ